jgi:uncharacterized membrane protein YphA (DoxX/SURF4 family)
MTPLRSARFRLFAVLLARLGLASTLISNVADRFGAWGRAGTPNVSWGDFQHFVARVQTIFPSAPAALALVMAWSATVLDAALGLGLFLGIRTRTMAFASGILFLVYAIATAVSPVGLHGTFGYGLLGLSGASMLLAIVVDDA